VITEGYLARHYQGRAGGRGPAIIDIAQDHLLHRLNEQGLFELGIALKGGTAIRKFRAGSAGRFSTDLDFAGVDDTTAGLLIEAVDGAQVGEFTFRTESIDGIRRVRLVIDTPFGVTEVPARLDLGSRSLWLPAEVLAPLPLPIHARYGFALPSVPTARVEEIVAEKLARFRRASLARDLYDLAWLSSSAFDERMVRRLTVLRVWCDVVNDGLGSMPFDCDDILRARDPGEFQPEAIGYLTTPVDIPAWVARVRKRFAFMRGMDEFESRVARCSRGDEREVRQAISGFRSPSG
jgi:predicted nucleotidyltransferase component of viral defense system